MAALLRIVVAAGDQALHALIEGTVLKHPGARVVAEVVQADALEDVVAHRAPQLVFLATRLGEASGFDLTAKLSRRYPGMYIVLVSPHPASPDDLRQAMRAGAREILSAPLDEAAVLHVLAETGDLDNVVGTRRGLVLGVMGSKGGVGKTTVAVNLAIALKGMQDGRVALVDGDLYFGDVAALMNIQPERTIREMSQTLSAEIAERFLHRHESGVEVLAAPRRTELAEEIPPDRFREGLNVLQGLYDLVVVDASVSSFEAMLAALEVADLAVVLTTLDVVCLKDTSQLLEMLAQLRFPAQNLLLVGNRADERLSLPRRDVEKALGMKFTALLPRDDRVIASANSGVPLVMSGPETPFAQQVRALAKTVMAYTGRMDRVTA
ncbi:MAG TPA: P-loop NTPase [bacterium]|nr:P-loop NTPase [bacterium]